MVIDDKLLTKLEALSMLKIQEDKRAQREKEISEILTFAEILNGIDVSNVDATFNTLNSGTPLREDMIKKDSSSKMILKHAPKSEDSFFVVPKIIE